MLNSVLGKKIEILPKVPGGHEQLCSTCGGTGWLLDETNGYLRTCTTCCGGIISLCAICHKPIRGICMNEECRNIRDAEAENNRLQKAKMMDFDEVSEESKIMMYSDRYSYNEGYFSDFDELFENCEANGVEIPEYVWATYVIELNMDAGDIIEGACEELHDEAVQNISDEDEKELQDLLNAWCSKQSGTDTYYIDYNIAIRVPEH